MIRRTSFILILDLMTIMYVLSIFCFSSSFSFFGQRYRPVSNRILRSDINIRSILQKDQLDLTHEKTKIEIKFNFSDASLDTIIVSCTDLSNRISHIYDCVSN